MIVQPLTDEQLAAIQTRADAATGGTWRYEAYAGLGPDGVLGAANIPVGRLDFGEGDQADADRAFVLAAHDDTAALLAEVHRLRAQQSASPALAAGEELLQRIAAALRAAARECGDGCGLADAECLQQHPVQVAVLDIGDVVAEIYGPVTALAAIAAGAVQPELDRLAAERDSARAQIAAVVTVRAWRNEDGREFLFADDVRTAPDAAADPTTT